MPGRDLHTPPDPLQQQIHPGQGVVHPEPGGDHLGDPRQRPALTLIHLDAAGPASSTAAGDLLVIVGQSPPASTGRGGDCYSLGYSRRSLQPFRLPFTRAARRDHGKINNGGPGC
jgi:hypothetical protein